MSNGQPPLKLRPPPKKGLSQDEALRRIEALDKWTEEPAKQAAATVAEPDPPAKATTGEGRAPWAIAGKTAEGQEATKSVNFKIPMETYQRLKWLGETTYGESMTSILVEALNEKIAVMLAERGIADEHH